MSCFVQPDERFEMFLLILYKQKHVVTIIYWGCVGVTSRRGKILATPFSMLCSSTPPPTTMTSIIKQNYHHFFSISTKTENVYALYCKSCWIGLCYYTGVPNKALVTCVLKIISSSLKHHPQWWIFKEKFT